MSFSFRNIFTPEDGESGGGPPREGGDSRHQRPYSPQEARGNEGFRTQVFQVSELLPFIPPAIVAQGGIPMAKEVEITLPADGSNDVLLSAIYQVCPELFAAEITPLNESTVTLPAKLTGAPLPAPESDSLFTPGAAFSKPPGMSAAHAPPLKSSPASPGLDKTNPFWSPEEGEEAPPAQPRPNNDMSEQRPQPSPSNHASEGSPVKGSGGSGGPPGQHLSSSPFVSGAPAPQSSEPRPPGHEAVPNGFSGPSFSGANPFEQKPTTEKEKPVKGAEPSPPTQFSGNPFESDEGYSTLFSTQAEADSEIPFPSPSAKTKSSLSEAAPEGTWGTMFDSNAASEEGDGAADPSEGFASIGNLFSGSLSKTGSPDPAIESASSAGAFEKDDEDDEDDYGHFLPPKEEAHELPSVFQMDSPVEEPAGLEEPKVSFEGNPDMPSMAFEPLKQPVEKGFTGVDTETADPPAEKRNVPAPAPVEQVASAKGSVFSDPSVSLTPLAPIVTEAPPKGPAPVPPQQFEQPESKPEPAPATVSATGAIPGLTGTGEIQDLELRAIFSTSDSFTLRSVARRVVALPGIASCALATPGRLIQASRNEESRIGDEAKEMVQTIRNLAKLTGLPDAQSFTLHTDRGIVSLFLDGDCCLTVHHDSVDFEPGIREKLILVSRNLENLEK